MDFKDRPSEISLPRIHTQTCTSTHVHAHILIDQQAYAHKHTCVCMNVHLCGCFIIMPIGPVTQICVCYFAQRDFVLLKREEDI